MNHFNKEYTNKYIFMCIANSYTSFDLILQIKSFYVTWFRVGYLGKYINLTLFNKDVSFYYQSYKRKSK